MSLSNVWMLLGLPVWFLGCLWFYRKQRQSLDWIDARVAERFRSRLTVYRRGTLVLHMGMIAVMGSALVFAMAGPSWSRSQSIAGGGRLLFVVDASASMNAEDAGAATDGSEALSRFEAAKRLASQIVDALEGWQFGVVSFSGSATFHLPLTEDRRLVEDAIYFLEVHNFYSHSGSSLSSALDAVLRFVDGAEPGLQVVLLGDGELPEPESYDEALGAIVAREIPIHAIAIGSEQGQGRVIYDFRDIVAKKEDPATLAEFTTRRVDEHFAAIASATGGSFRIHDGTPIESLVAAIARTPVRVASDASTAGTDLSALFLGSFLLLFLFDSLVYGYRGEPAHEPFRLEALVSRPRRASPVPSRTAGKARGAGLVLLVLAGCHNAGVRAHLENEQGIVLDSLGQTDRAESHYLRSIAYDYHAEIPTTNLGRSKTLDDGFSEGHAYFERALEIEPRLYEAHFNDGVALYRWGESLRDPDGCELERTLELWEQASRRFEQATELSDAHSGAVAARDNWQHVEQRLADIRRLFEDSKEDCSPPPGEAGESGDAGESSSGPSDEDPDTGPAAPEDQDEPEESADGDDPQSETTPEPSSGETAEQTVSSGAPLSDEELSQIRDAIAASQGARREGERFFRGSRAEQFPSESWKNPKRVVW